MVFPTPFYRWRPHPWHGLEVGPNPPQLVHAYIEITPFDVVKYEIDKVTGYLRVDRPQRTSSQPPTLYGFIPRTFCGRRVGALCPGVEHGDCDPLDICVVSERQITRAEVILPARVVGKPSQFSIEKVYGCEEAFAVIAAAIEDYNEEYG
jgi:inorganic pyrophosphatase